MTKRKLFLVATDAGGNDDTGMAVDLATYRRFFTSDNGGAWEEDEILEFTQKSPLTYTYIDSLRGAGAYDYCVFVFCGHGAILRDGSEIGIHLNQNEGLFPTSRLRSAFRNTRSIIILDSCQGPWTPEDGEDIRFFSINESIGSPNRREYCRKKYDNIFLKNNTGSCQIGTAASMKEYAHGDEMGGLYSQSLIKSALEELKTNREKSIITFEEIHDAAYILVTNTVDNQHPTFEGSELDTNIQFPFIILT